MIHLGVLFASPSWWALLQIIWRGLLLFEEDVVWEESCGGLVLVMAVSGARNVPSCSLSVEDMWCGGALLTAVCLLACCAGLGMVLGLLSIVCVGKQAWYGECVSAI